MSSIRVPTQTDLEKRSRSSSARHMQFGEKRRPIGLANGPTLSQSGRGLRPFTLV
ncbi:hypothetical protein RISK_006739 [Rhodopirellula islandica]|uniref:Uncharacterized protein n=1 Tax=Rhodopirellula islandica TaxID=595434 RepID=A0A0J1B2M2_RHOIS|nr:hypothetical protein RISK_006739 [Rhodopirellula islandica]